MSEMQVFLFINQLVVRSVSYIVAMVFHPEIHNVENHITRQSSHY